MFILELKQSHKEVKIKDNKILCYEILLKEGIKVFLKDGRVYNCRTVQKVEYLQ